MARTKTKDATLRKDGFLFVGNDVVLDFVNTRPLQDGEPIELLPDFNALLRWFHAAGLLETREMSDLKQRWGRSAASHRTLEAMRRWRERLRKQILTWENGGAVYQSTIDELNQLTADHPMRNQLTKNGKKLSAALHFKLQNPDDLFAPLAHAAAMLFANADRDRVRKCNQCVLHFLDTSKKGTRRWCSMQLCGNRLKVAAYAARHRSGNAEKHPTLVTR